MGLIKVTRKSSMQMYNPIWVNSDHIVKITEWSDHTEIVIAPTGERIEVIDTALKIIDSINATS